MSSLRRGRRTFDETLSCTNWPGENIIGEGSHASKPGKLPTNRELGCLAGERERETLPKEWQGLVFERPVMIGKCSGSSYGILADILQSAQRPVRSRKLRNLSYLCASRNETWVTQHASTSFGQGSPTAERNSMNAARDTATTTQAFL